jgi:uncharacterized OB-fold protein
MQRITNNEGIRLWRDRIPLEYKYTAGIAGERFLQLLKQAKIQGSFCRSCGKTFLPPKIFCKDCFVQVIEWKEIPTENAYVYSFTTVKKTNGEAPGSKRDGDATIALVKFEGVEGGLLGKLKPGREEPRIGMKVKPVFKPKDQRTGQLSDIEYFEKT